MARTKTPGPDQLVEPIMGAYEVAEKLGVSVHNLGTISGLPDPVHPMPGVPRLRSTRVWRAAEIEAFAVTWEQRREERRKRLQDQTNQ